ncbi:hypothetical protein DEH69_02415 [Streptomyces sp. PT12]|nr:hypothetical protein DEH69_02415 [Streptomyces sp. PT12]
MAQGGACRGGRRWHTPTQRDPTWRRKEAGVTLVFLAPTLLGFLAFYAWPTLRGLYLSFTDYDLLSAPEFSGLDNYRGLVEDDVFWNSLLFTAPDSPLPVDFTWGSLERVLGTASTEEAQAEGGSGASMAFWGYLRNSVIVSTLITAGQVFFSALAAYAFARLRWPGRDKVFFAFVTALMVPPVFTMLPNFLLIKNLDLINTDPGVVAPFFLMTPFAVFFLRQFFLALFE